MKAGNVMECNECKNEQRITALEKDSERNQSAHKEFFRKFETVKTAQAVSDERYTTIIKELGKVSCKLEEINEKPAKRWDSVVEKVLMLIISAVVLYMLAKMGL